MTTPPHTVIHRFVCPRCRRSLTIANPRAEEALDEEFRRDFPDAADAGVDREEVCDDCYETILKGGQR